MLNKYDFLLTSYCSVSAFWFTGDSVLWTELAYSPPSPPILNLVPADLIYCHILSLLPVLNESPDFQWAPKIQLFHPFTMPCSITSHRPLEIGRGGRMNTTEIGQHLQTRAFVHAASQLLNIYQHTSASSLHLWSSRPMYPTA